ncbi:MAG: hypothetical protein HY927_05705 [Elusimicrobia bacterium]|nr:hypothetical protein [Elusimicrobiota bacterium]
MNSNICHTLLDPFLTTIDRVASYVPNLLAAFLLLLAGMFTARALRTVAEGLLAKARLDEHTSKVGINEILARLGMGKSPTYGICFLIYWFVLFIFIVSAANAVNMTAVSEMLERFLLFLPKILAGILILFGGLLFARFLSEIVDAASQANSVPGGSHLARALYVSVLVFASITALEQFGIETRLISAAVQIILASAGLALALAFGLGGRDVAAEAIRDVLKRRNNSPPPRGGE